MAITNIPEYCSATGELSEFCEIVGSLLFSFDVLINSAFFPLVLFLGVVAIFGLFTALLTMFK